MNCERLRESLSAELDGEARALQRRSVGRHLAACADCRRARAAALSLRKEIDLAASAISPNEVRDEAILAALRRAGVCRRVGQEATQSRTDACNRTADTVLRRLYGGKADTGPSVLIQIGLAAADSGLASALRPSLS